MKFASAFRLCLLIALSSSLTLAENNKEELKNPYGIAFSLEDAATLNSQRITVTGSVPGEGSKPSEPNTESITNLVTPTTTTSSTEETPVTVTVTSSDDKKDIKSDESDDKDQPTFMIAKDDDDDDKSPSPSDDNNDPSTNPRLVFIERLMGLHLTGPSEKESEGEEKDDEPKKEQDIESDIPIKNPAGDKVNAKWASRMRQFSVPMMQQQGMQQQTSGPEQTNPLLRYAAAAMMTRLLAAAARANHQSPIMGKDKDDNNENDEDTVPVLLATMRSNEEGGPIGGMRGISGSMYGRPMPRPQLRSPMVNYQLAQQARMVSHSAPQRTFSSPPGIMRPSLSSSMNTPMQPVVIMLAHVPMQQSESRMGPSISVNPYGAPQQSSSYYPQVSYAAPMGYHSMPRHVIPVEIPVPVHVPIPVASYHRPVYQSPYQAYQPYQHEPTYNSHIQRRDFSPSHMQSAFTHSRPVIEVPIEIPVNVPYNNIIKSSHQPIMMSMNNDQDQDQDTSASEAEQVAIVYYDPEGQDQDDPNEPQFAESNENVFKIAPGSKHFPFLGRPLPDNRSSGKIKLWREFVNEKHSSQPGVRYIPVAMESQSENKDMNVNVMNSHPHPHQHQHDQASETESTESQTQSAIMIVTDENNPDESMVQNEEHH